MSLGKELAPHLPFLRRYARALTGAQEHGDKLVKATLESIVAAPDQFPRDVDTRLGLYGRFQQVWDRNPTGDTGAASVQDGSEGIARLRLAQVTPRSRQALLLTAMEGFTSEDAAVLMDCDRTDIDRMVSEALEEIERQTHAEVLIIEDEPLIAMDLESLVRDLGHNVTAIATTRTEAVALLVMHGLM